MRSLVEESAHNFPDSIAISYKDRPSDKEVRKVSFTQWRDDVSHHGTALIAEGLREECSFFAVMAIGSPNIDIIAYLCAYGGKFN